MSSSGRRTGGVVQTFAPGAARAIEQGTHTCAHCQHVVAVHDANGMRLSAEQQPPFCLQCYRVICNACGELGKCTPFEAKIEAYEKEAADAARFGRQLEAVLR
jgi:hypothetical protein